MEPPLGSQPCPLGLVQPLQPGGRSQAGRGSPQARPGRPLFAPIKSPRSIDPESPAEPREGDNPFRSAPNPSQRLPDKPGARLRHVSALPVRRVRFGPSQLPRQNASLTFGVCERMDQPWRLPAEVMCRVQREKTWYSGQRGCILSPCKGQNGNPGLTSYRSR